VYYPFSYVRVAGVSRQKLTYLKYGVHCACKDFTTFLTVISTTMTGMQTYEMLKTLISFSV